MKAGSSQEDSEPPRVECKAIRSDLDSRRSASNACLCDKPEAARIFLFVYDSFACAQACIAFGPGPEQPNP